MPKNSLTDYSATNASNTDVGGINIDEGMQPSDVNNAIREVMTHLKEFEDGTNGITKLSAADAEITGTGAIKVPVGTTAQRPTPATGQLRFNSTDSSFEGYDGSAWGAIGGGAENSFTVFEYTATASQTTFSGADDNAATLSYTAGNIQVILNGVVLDPSDYTATNGTSVVLASGAALNDVLNIYAFTSFTVADTVSASTGGTFSANVTVTGDLTVDTNTLYVDSTNNRVGIGTSLPLGPLHISSDGSETDFRSVSTKAGIALNYNGGGISYYDSDTTIFRKSTSGSSTELMRILPSGGITFNGDTAAANALDDYEEGTWTPTPISLTTSGTVTYTGTYTKIGRFVFGLLTVVSSGGTTTATADTTRFSGLPFTSDSIGGMGLSVITGTTSGTAAGQVGGAGTTLITGGWSATSSIRMSFWYTTT